MKYRLSGLEISDLWVFFMDSWNCDLCINDCGLSLKITTDNSFLYLRYNERKKSGQ